MKKVDCTHIGKELLAHVKKFLASNNLTPQLAIVQIGEDDEVCSNTKSLENKRHVRGIDVIAEHLSKDSAKNHLMSCVEKLNNDSNIDGFYSHFLQLYVL